MFATVTFEQAQITPIAPRHAVAEASTMGLEPGYWPDFVAVLNAKGQGFLLMRSRRIDAPEGELGGYVYYGREDGLRLDILND